MNVLIFLFREVLGRDIEDIQSFTRATSKRRVPTVLSQVEIRRLLHAMNGKSKMMASLMYGSGMRVMECVRLRVQDVDIDYQQITLRQTKDGKERVVPLPEKLIPAIESHLIEVKKLHSDDVAEGYGEALMPAALSRKLGAATKSWAWQFVFPATQLAFDHRASKTRRHHIHETGLQKAIRNAAKTAVINKRVTSHTLRHSFTAVW